MHHIDASIETFERLRKMGIKLPLMILVQGVRVLSEKFTVDELKIDREFIHDLTPNSKE